MDKKAVDADAHADAVTDKVAPEAKTVAVQPMPGEVIAASDKNDGTVGVSKNDTLSASDAPNDSTTSNALTTDKEVASGDQLDVGQHDNEHEKHSPTGDISEDARKAAAKANAETNQHGQATIISAGSTPRRFSKRTLVLAAALLVAVVAGSFFLWQSGSKEESASSPVAVEKRKQSLTTARNLNEKNDFKGEIKALQAYIDSDPPKEFAAETMIQLATSYSADKDYDNAIKTYQSVLDEYPDDPKLVFAATRGMAFTYKRQGNVAKAIEYFEKALALEKASSSPDINALVGQEEVTIQTLKAQLR